MQVEREEAEEKAAAGKSVTPAALQFSRSTASRERELMQQQYR